MGEGGRGRGDVRRRRVQAPSYVRPCLHAHGRLPSPAQEPSPPLWWRWGRPSTIVRVPDGDRGAVHREFRVETAGRNGVERDIRRWVFCLRAGAPGAVSAGRRDPSEPPFEMRTRAGAPHAVPCSGLDRDCRRDHSMRPRRAWSHGICRSEPSVREAGLREWPSALPGLTVPDTGGVHRRGCDVECPKMVDGALDGGRGNPHLPHARLTAGSRSHHRAIGA